MAYNFAKALNSITSLFMPVGMDFFAFNVTSFHIGQKNVYKYLVLYIFLFLAKWLRHNICRWEILAEETCCFGYVKCFRFGSRHHIMIKLQYFSFRKIKFHKGKFCWNFLSLSRKMENNIQLTIIKYILELSPENLFINYNAKLLQ